MIVKINSTFAKGMSEQQLSDKCAAIMQYRHYISCDGETRRLIASAIEKNGSKTQKDILLTYKGFDITQEIRTYLTSVDLADCNNFDAIIKSPSEILVENGPYEADVYKRLPEGYKHDPLFKHLYALLADAFKRNRVICTHGGGYGTYEKLMEQKNDNEYKDVYRLKCCAVIDRDTDCENTLDPLKRNLLLYLCGKDISQITDNDIYTLNQPTGWIWHMWYKRAVENYFPKECYERMGINVDECDASPLGWDYYNIGNIAGYKKNMVPNLVSDMSRQKYEKRLKHFCINGVDMSEMQLLLLKFVKLI